MFTLCSTNENKRDIFNDYFGKGNVNFVDIEFVDNENNDHNVILIDKIRQANKLLTDDFCIEDMYFVVDGKQINSLKEFVSKREYHNYYDKEAKFVSKIAYKKGNKIYIYTGEVNGTIIKYPQGYSEYEFDNHFLLLENNKTLGELTFQERNEQGFNVRRLSCEKLHVNDYSLVLNINYIL